MESRICSNLGRIQAAQPVRPRAESQIAGAAFEVMQMQRDDLLEEFVLWLCKNSQMDSEDIHQFRNLSTHECKELLKALQYSWQDHFED